MGSSNDDSNDWLVVDSDGALGSVSEEEAMLRIFGPLDAEPDLEDLLDAEIEVKDSAGAPPKRTTQRTLDDLFRGKPKAKPSSSRQTAGSHGSGNASSSSHGFDFERALRGLSTSGTTKTPKSHSNEATNGNISGSAEGPGDSLLVMESEDSITIYFGNDMWLSEVIRLAARLDRHYAPDEWQ